jgi:hypothetical protein
VSADLEGPSRRLATDTAVITTGRRADEPPRGEDPGPLDRAFDQLRCAAVELVNTHVRHRGRLCASCGRGWPCDAVLLADHNLTLVGDPPAQEYL